MDPSGTNFKKPSCKKPSFKKPRLSYSLLLAAAVLLNAQSTVPGRAKGVPNFHRVNEHIYRGGQPSEAGLEALHAMGVKTVLDLRPTTERTVHEDKLLESRGMKYVNIPMPALGAPTLESVQNAIQVLTTDKAWPIFVHCQRGADRTGTVVACYRIQMEGWTSIRAMQEAEHLGLAPFQTGKKHFILSWNPPSGKGSIDSLVPVAPSTSSH